MPLNYLGNVYDSGASLQGIGNAFGNATVMGAQLRMRQQELMRQAALDQAYYRLALQKQQQDQAYRQQAFSAEQPLRESQLARDIATRQKAEQDVSAGKGEQERVGTLRDLLGVQTRMTSLPEDSPEDTQMALSALQKAGISTNALPTTAHALLPMVQQAIRSVEEQQAMTSQSGLGHLLEPKVPTMNPQQRVALDVFNRMIPLYKKYDPKSGKYEPDVELATKSANALLKVFGVNEQLPEGGQGTNAPSADERGDALKAIQNGKDPNAVRRLYKQRTGKDADF